MIIKPNKAEQLIYKALNRALEQNKLDIYLDFSKINRPNCPLYNPWEAILPLLAPTLLGLIMIMIGWVISGLFFISVMMMGYSQYYKKILHKKLAQRCREYITKNYENLETLWHKGGLAFVLTHNKNIGILAPEGNWKELKKSLINHIVDMTNKRLSLSCDDLGDLEILSGTLSDGSLMITYKKV